MISYYLQFTRLIILKILIVNFDYWHVTKKKYKVNNSTAAGYTPTNNDHLFCQ